MPGGEKGVIFDLFSSVKRGSSVEKQEPRPLAYQIARICRMMKIAA
jgi:hypothetical protein